MKIREEDFDINEGLDRFKNDRQIEKDERYLKTNPAILQKILNTALKEEQLFSDGDTYLLGIHQIRELNLKGEYLGKSNTIQSLEDYSGGYIELLADIFDTDLSIKRINVNVSYRWSDHYYSYSLS